MIIIKVIDSEESKSKKVIQKTDDDYLSETGVFDDHECVHLCISSQLGCVIACKMCYNGINPSFFRNLSDLEIIQQCVNVINMFDLDKKYEQIWFSFMGVGEPLLNYNNVIKSIHVLNEMYPNSCFAIATTGIKMDLIPKLADDLKDINNFKLTISLHAAHDEKRKFLIPAHDSLIALRKNVDLYKQLSNHRYEFNYVLLKGFNDSLIDVKWLSEFLVNGEKMKISSYNYINNGFFYQTTKDEYKKFCEMLRDVGIEFSTFYSVGSEIDVGCGQMASKLYKRKEKLFTDV